MYNYKFTSVLKNVVKVMFSVEKQFPGNWNWLPSTTIAE